MMMMMIMAMVCLLMYRAGCSTPTFMDATTTHKHRQSRGRHTKFYLSPRFIYLLRVEEREVLGDGCDVCERC